MRRIGLVLLILFYAAAGIMHFVAIDAMTGIVPPWVPYPRAVVIVTGVCELVGAVALVHPGTRAAAGVAFALYALCVWPANMQHAIRDLGAGTGLSIWYHAPRLALQPLIIAWALWASGALRRWGRRR